MKLTANQKGSLTALTASLVLTFGSQPAGGQTELRLPPGVAKVTSVEGITEYSLPNGLRVLLFPDSSKPIITVNITYRVGSRHEGYGEKGMAHLLEHLVFKGTPRHRNIPQELTEHGSRANGTTWFDRTNYYETFDATEENLRWALDLEADRMVNSFISKKDLESEFTVVRNEYEMGENRPTSVLYKRMLATVFQWHNYGRDTIGEKSDIERAPIERLQAFYRNYYQPDNAVLLVAGKIEEQKILELVHEYFASIPKPTRQLIPTYTKEPTQDGERQVVLRRIGDVQVVSCMYPIVAGSHPDFAALSVLGNLLADEPSGRLYKALVDTRKAARISGTVEGFAEAGLAGFLAEVRQEHSLEEAKLAMLTVLDDSRTNSPTQEEVEGAKSRLLKDFELLLKQSDRIGLALSEYIGTGDWRLAFLYRDSLEQVTRDEVSRMAQRYLKPANRTLGLFIPDPKPDRTEIQDAPDVAVLVKEYKGKAALSQGEDFDASPANIEARTTRGKMSNSFQYALLPKETRGHAVRATMTFRFGSLESLRNKVSVGELTVDMLNKGTKTKTRQQLKDAFDRLKARVTVSGGEPFGTSGGGPFGFALGGVSSATVAIETDREHLAEVLGLVREIMREASFPVDEFEKLKDETLAGLEDSKSDPNALALNLFRRISRPTYAKDDPRYTMTFEEAAAALAALTPDQVQEFYKTFYGASHATAAVVGDFDSKQIETVLREGFGDWRNPSEYQRIPLEYQPVTARSETINTPDKANASYVAGSGFAMREDDPEFPALMIGGHLIGGGFLNSRLATRIRQKEGLSYGVGGGFLASPLDRDARFAAWMIYNPENVAKLETAFREEIEKVAKEGFTAEELQAGKTGWLKSRKVARSSDGALSRTLSTFLFYGRDLMWDAKQEEAVQNISLAQVQDAVRKYLDYSKIISVKAGDFSKPTKF